MSVIDLLDDLVETGLKRFNTEVMPLLEQRGLRAPV